MQGPPHSPRTNRPTVAAAAPRWPWIPLALVLLIQLVGFWTVASYTMQPSSGLYIRFDWDGRLIVFPATVEAAARIEGRPGPLRVVAVNDWEVPPGFSIFQLRQRLQLQPGASNRFLLEDSRGERLEIRIAAARPHAATVLTWRYLDILYWVVGLLFLGLGLFVWRQRPGDPSALALMLFTLVAAQSSAVVVHPHPAGLVLLQLRLATFALYGPGLLYFVLVFTGSLRKRLWRWLLRGGLVVAALLGTGKVLALYLWRGTPLGTPVSTGLSAATSALLIACVLCGVLLTWQVARPPAAPGVRRRAHVLGWALLLAFLFPSAWPLFRAYFTSPELQAAAVIAQMLCLASFPLLVGYAVLRLQMFDVRVMLRQGLVYGALSVGVSLGYVMLIVVAYGIAGRHAQTPLFSAVMLVGLVLAVSMVKLRVQGAVDRLVFRSRYLYADAVSQASAQLARARTVTAVHDAMRQALIQTMGLSRAFVTHRPQGTPLDAPDANAWPVETLATDTPRHAPHLLFPLPQGIRPGDFEPLARVLRSHQPASVYDTVAIEAAIAGAGAATDKAQLDEGRSEASFWQHFGLELALPLLGGDPTPTVLGLLLVGPRSEGRALDPTDRELVATLANQLAMALESSIAFEEIARLKDNLEAQVVDRTRELSDTLQQLQATQTQLVDSQTHAALGRVVAGVVHEINSPLGVLRSSTDTVRRVLRRCNDYLGRDQQRQCPPSGHTDRPAPDASAPSDEAARLKRSIASGDELTAVMEQSSARIHEVIESLKHFVSLDEAPHKAIDVREGLESALTLLAPRLEQRIEVVRHYAERQTQVRCDPARLNRVFFNLLENAIKAIDGPGQVTVTIDATGNRVRVQVEDNGRGISAAKLPHVFDIGFTTKRGGRVGMQMGLAHCKRTVEDIGGTLVLRSTEGQGTRADVFLPCAAAR